uniref:DNA-directed RNA polymerase III subunit RPC10 n=2 Tax=Anopheles culicifacies TaxID=139723 RepID=A0A182M6Q1_9DIPT
MLMFCPTCGNLLLVEEGTDALRFSCNTCPYICKIRQRISSRIYPKLKEVDHVMGGAAAWENVDSTDAVCPSCSNNRAYFMQMQTRSADEPMTTFYKCCNQTERIGSVMNVMNRKYDLRTTVVRTSNLLNTAKDKPLIRPISVRSKRAIKIAVNKLKNGDVIAIPTDTVYGLACSAMNATAVHQMYEIKGRNELKPVAICVAEIDDLRRWGETAHLSDNLLNELLPGAVTIVVKRSPTLANPMLNPEVANIGIRITKHPFIQEVCRQFGLPIALTSANKSASRSTLQVHEFEDLWPQLGAVFDGGHLGLSEKQRAASTVIDLSTPEYYKIIRYGVSVETIIKTVEKYNIRLAPQSDFYYLWVA